MIKTGQPAPDFSAPSHTGETIKLSDYKGKKNVVLFFYPGDFTPVCTKEACSFNDSAADFEKHDAQLLGISKDDLAKHKSFAGRYGLNYPLLTDEGYEIAKSFGITRPVPFLPAKRVTFVIDKEGMVQAVIHKELDYNGIVAAAKKALENL